MKFWHLAMTFPLALAMFSANGATAHAPDDAGTFVRIKPDEIKWTGSATGVQSAILAGDPNRSGPYLMRVKFPQGAMTRPHRHSQDRFVTVISGTWYTGIGETFDPDNTVGLPAGSFMKHPAHGAHYDGAKDGEVIVQISGMGPVSTIYLEAAGSPNGTGTK